MIQFGIAILLQVICEMLKFNIVNYSIYDCALKKICFNSLTNLSLFVKDRRYFASINHFIVELTHQMRAQHLF